jgi:hypothetical protein
MLMPMMVMMACWLKDMFLCIISAQSVAVMACKAAWHKTLKRCSVLRKKKRLLRKKKTHP